MHSMDSHHAPGQQPEKTTRQHLINAVEDFVISTAQAGDALIATGAVLGDNAELDNVVAFAKSNRRSFGQSTVCLTWKAPHLPVSRQTTPSTSATWHVEFAMLDADVAAYATMMRHDGQCWHFGPVSDWDGLRAAARLPVSEKERLDVDQH